MAGDGPARVTATLTVRLGDLAVTWAPSSDADDMPVEVRDGATESVVAYTDLNGIEEFREALRGFVEHHRRESTG